jgi:hypothetical protein
MDPLALDSENAENYGLLWWINEADNMPKEYDAQGDLVVLPTDAYWGWGLGDSIMMVIPSYDIIITRTGTAWTGDYGPSDYQKIYDKLVFPILSQYSTAAISPTITSTPVTTGTVGQPYTYDVDATGSPAPSYSLMTAPAGMSIDVASGIISWTPTAAGNFSVTVEANNTAGTDSQNFTIDVAFGPTTIYFPMTAAANGQLHRNK